MPGKKKKSSGARPVIVPQDSMRRDIEAARSKNLEAISSSEAHEVEEAEDGLDVADQLMATLNARDRAAVQVDNAARAEAFLQVPETSHSNKSRSPDSGHSNSSASPRRGPGELLLHAGEKIFGSHHSKSPPPISIGSPESTDIDSSLSSSMQRKGSIRERLFKSSPNRDDTNSPEGDKRKVSRQQARKVGVCCLEIEGCSFGVDI